MQRRSPALDAKIDSTSTATIAFGVVVDRDESDPDTAEHQHAECQELGFIECIRQIPGQESYSETC